jgi:hypothetical protein
MRNQEDRLLLEMWSLSFFPDPLASNSQARGDAARTSTTIVSARITIENLLIANNNNNNNNDTESSILFSAFKEAATRDDARTVLADLTARQIIEQREKCQIELDGGFVASLEPLDRALTKSRRRKQNNIVYPPYILDRTDIWCSESELNVTLRMNCVSAPQVATNNGDEKKQSEEEKAVQEYAAKSMLTKILKHETFYQRLLSHIVSITLQHRMRSQLLQMKAVAFIADGSILPRKSGTSDAPMASPPIVSCHKKSQSKWARLQSIYLRIIV